MLAGIIGSSYCTHGCIPIASAGRENRPQTTDYHGAQVPWERVQGDGRRAANIERKHDTASVARQDGGFLDGEADDARDGGEDWWFVMCVTCHSVVCNAQSRVRSNLGAENNKES